MTKNKKTHKAPTFRYRNLSVTIMMPLANDYFSILPLIEMIFEACSSVLDDPRDVGKDATNLFSP